MLLRNIQWKVTDQSVAEPLLGRPILKALGLNCEKTLGAEADRHAGYVDAAQHFVHDDHGKNSGRIGRILEGVLHADGGEKEFDDDSSWWDLGPETEDEWKKHFYARWATTMVIHLCRPSAIKMWTH